MEGSLEIFVEVPSVEAAVDPAVAYETAAVAPPLTLAVVGITEAVAPGFPGFLGLRAHVRLSRKFLTTAKIKARSRVSETMSATLYKVIPSQMFPRRLAGA